jgi:hypothetical protein
MDKAEKEKKYKKDGFEYEFYKALSKNWEKAERKDLWLTENYNSTGMAFSERLTWLAGIGIALLPLIFGTIPPDTSFKKVLIISAILLLLLSIFMGGFDFISTYNFWRRHSLKNKKAINIWYEGIKEIHTRYPNEEDCIYDKTMQRINDLELNKEQANKDIYLTIQILSGFLAISLFVVYLILSVLL